MQRREPKLNRPDPARAGRIVGVLLAAGSSLRFGSDKLLQPASGGRSIAEAAAGKLLAACDHALAVVGPRSSEQLVERLRLAGLEVLMAQRAQDGMGATLAAGVNAASQASGWVVALADMPAIRPASVAAVVQALRRGASIAAPSYRGRRGHPVGFAAQWLAALTRLAGDSGARKLLDAHADQVACVEVDDPGILFDVDTDADLALLRRFDAPTSLG